MRTQQVASEALLGLRRNVVMTIAAVLTVSVSMAFVGAALLLRQTVNDMQEYFYTQIEVSVFLTDEVTQAQRDDVAGTLADLPLVQNTLYESKQIAYDRFQEQFQDSPDLLANVTADALPESYRVKLIDPEQYEVVASAVRDLPGVEQVVDQRRFLDQLFNVLNGLRNFAFYTAILQLVAATLLIANTVRVTAFSRRRETGVMRLVGATRLNIALPFLLEGIIAGAIGALLGTGLLMLGKALLLDRTLESVFGNGIIPEITYTDIGLFAPWLLLIGVTVSAVASLVTLQRYIRV